MNRHPGSLLGVSSKTVRRWGGWQPSAGPSSCSPSYSSWGVPTQSRQSQRSPRSPGNLEPFCGRTLPRNRSVTTSSRWPRHGCAGRRSWTTKTKTMSLTIPGRVTGRFCLGIRWVSGAGVCVLWARLGRHVVRSLVRSHVRSFVRSRARARSSRRWRSGSRCGRI